MLVVGFALDDEQGRWSLDNAGLARVGGDDYLETSLLYLGPATAFIVLYLGCTG